ncbi:DNA translocase FtsK [Allocoprobacillus halotolerans]|uniref:DNA translocase FtsK n=1 Tax=Allocoprobacillus halotolerans TaxID=2944914 RepID=A0ABY5I1Z5_9FIRM|nr:DNA translocase FtsK [Allocoprobacillus halotolerans]UTY38782.1 DNA translocase FtsK [Allocoprobacillus halotolerans]
MPNQSGAVVGFKDVLKNLLSQSKFQNNPLVVALGKDVSGKPVFAQLDKMPHLLIAGATGSGKSVCVNTIISSLLMRARPDEVKLILVDPKKVELSVYNGIPHLLAPVVTDPKKAAAVLREVVSEMERRYDLFASVSARNIETYNEFVKKYNDKHGDEPKEILPYHVIILDEVADLMMVASKDVEDCIMRISQMARAAGIHLIVATQRPSTDIITGVIKANIPSRIAFAVSSSIDSRTILDTSGAEKLLGKGDMLFSPMGSSSPTRVQGCFVTDDEVASIVHYVSSQQEAIYEDKYVNVKSISSSQSNDSFDEEDEEYEMCREFVIQAQKASTSLLQRKFRIGYNKAARIIDRLEEDGVIGPQLGSKPREVYIRQYHEEDL